MINVKVLQKFEKQEKSLKFNSKKQKNTFVRNYFFILIGDYGKRDWYQGLVASRSEVKKLDM